jgi:zinc protease
MKIFRLWRSCFYGGYSFAMTDVDPDDPALKIEGYIFGEGQLSSRLSNRVRQKEGLSYGVGSFLRADPIDKAGLFMIYAITNPHNISKVDNAITEELDRMIKAGVTEKELAEAKHAYLQQLKTQRSMDRFLASEIGSGLHVGRTYAYYAGLERKVMALTPQQVSEAFRKYIEPKRLVIVRAGDFKTTE